MNELPDIDLGCFCCYKRFVNEQELHRHLIQNHPDKKDAKWFDCDDCDEVFKDQASREAHGHLELVHNCVLCSQGFSTDKELKEHVAKHHRMSAHHMSAEVKKRRPNQSGRKMECRICRALIAARYIYEHAKESHYDEVSQSWFKCNVCSNFYPDETILDRHALNNHRKRKAPAIGKGKGRCGNLDPPSSAKSEPQPSTSSGKTAFKFGKGFPFCDDCRHKSHGLAIHKHVNSKHREEASNFWKTCPFCSQLYRNNGSLKTHLKRSHRHLVQESIMSENEEENVAGTEPASVEREVQEDTEPLGAGEVGDFNQDVDMGVQGPIAGERQANVENGAHVTFTVVMPRQDAAVLQQAAILNVDENQDADGGTVTTERTSNPRPYVCVKCMVEFDSKKDLCRHVNRSGHNPRSWPFCKTCLQYNPRSSKHLCEPFSNLVNCFFCKIGFTSLDDVITHCNLAHLKLISSSGWVPCSNCLNFVPIEAVEGHKMTCLRRQPAASEAATDPVDPRDVRDCPSCQKPVAINEFEAHFDAEHYI